MLIAICDDEETFRKTLVSNIISYKTSRHLHIDIEEFSSGPELLASKQKFDMIFLDYLMPTLNGMTVARALRQRNITCCIVFITSYPQFVYESFEVTPFRFYTKPFNLEQLTSLLNSFIKQIKLLSPIIVINEGEQQVISPKDILYLEGNGKYCIIRVTNKTYYSSKTLAQVHALLPQHCFYRTHKSFVINLYSVSSFDKKSVMLINGELAKIGQGKFSKFKSIYKQFIHDYYIKV